MREFTLGSTRKREEEVRLEHLLKMLIWAKRKTGLSSAEIVNTVLRKRK